MSALVQGFSLFFLVLLTGCNNEYVEKQLDSLSSPKNKDALQGVYNTVKEETENVLEAGEEVLDVSKQALDSTESEIEESKNTGKNTTKNVKTREQLMEDAGGKMIEDMR